MAGSSWILRSRRAALGSLRQGRASPRALGAGRAAGAVLAARALAVLPTPAAPAAGRACGPFGHSGSIAGFIKLIKQR